ncbi:MAG TPA: tRNA (adenosine(37)-N6)-dimethylallyltransferase MiaA [Thermoanaerobaculaceae bacterium]|nr:tRNA (adenosine(37)-N6)-dimethylallyltransferase MiaA [Thermoanaerobaculaceae bacterium]
MSDLLVIVGPTASGKTELAAALAERLGGEVVSADAFAVYRGLDIGTAKPDLATRARVPHHLIDVADPRERYSAGMFVRDADAAIHEIRNRGRLPVVVGGTHFYVRALLYGLFPEPPKDPRLRQMLEAEWAADPAAVRARLAALDPESTVRIASADRQRTVRALEVCLLAGRPMTALWRDHPRVGPRYPFLMLGLRLPRAELHARIGLRVESMFAAGLLREVKELLAEGLSPQAHALKAIGYRESCQVLAGALTAQEAVERAKAATRRLAKRQMTWLRGETEVEWLAGAGAELLAAATSRVEARGGTGTGAG